MATQVHGDGPQPVPQGNGKGHASVVNVTAREISPGQWDFSMTQDGVAREDLEFRKEGKKKVDWHDVSFRLIDPSGKLAFHPDRDDALWVARGDEHGPPPCPTSRSADPEKEFRVKSDPKPNELLVHNGNNRECYLNYRLNFVAAGSGSKTIVASHDPVVGNKNGGEV